MEPPPRLAGSVPAFVEREFEAYLKCGRLEHGFLRVRRTTCHAERLVAFSCKRRGFCPRRDGVSVRRPESPRQSGVLFGLYSRRGHGVLKTSIIRRLMNE